MNSPTMSCDDQRIELYLAEGLSDSEAAEFVDHLDQCVDCRESLEARAAAPDVWCEARECLLTPEWEQECQPEHEMPLPIRQVLDSLAPSEDPRMLGRLAGYEVSGVVGVGGMGVVLKAVDRSLDRTVAIKVLSPHLAISGAARNRFAREAKAAAAVVHPNVIAIHGVDSDNSLPWFVMPYLKGMSLQKRIEVRGPLPVAEVLRIGSQVARGLSAAHAQGLVHRDIKPANILLEDGVERVTITDFGLARAADEAAMTRSGMISGTPQYMSPEQSLGKPLDSRSDLFSLGSLMYAMCTGYSPFRAESVVGILRRITDSQPQAVDEINAEIPPWLSGILCRLMEKDPANRFQSTAEVASLLEECLAHIQQPTRNKLPRFVHSLSPKRQPLLNFWGYRGFFITLMSAVSLAIAGWLGAMWISGGDPPEIEGSWLSDAWGKVELKEVSEGHVVGEFNDSTGRLVVEWSFIEQRYNGTWRNGNGLRGKISLRKVDGQIHGARSLHRSIDASQSNPRLTEFAWQETQAPGPTTANESPNRQSLWEPLLSESKVAEWSGKIQAQRARVEQRVAEVAAAQAELNRFADILAQYEQVTYPRLKNEAEKEVLQARAELLKAKQEISKKESQLEHSRRLREKDLITENQLAEDVLNLDQAILGLSIAEKDAEIANQKLEVLQGISHGKTLQQYRSNLEAARAKLSAAKTALEAERAALVDLDTEKIKFWRDARSDEEASDSDK